MEFASKVREAATRASSCDPAEAITCPSGARNPVQHGFDYQNYLRTEPCSFSWDWGPGNLHFPLTSLTHSCSPSRFLKCALNGSLGPNNRLVSSMQVLRPWACGARSTCRRKKEYYLCVHGWTQTHVRAPVARFDTAVVRDITVTTTPHTSRDTAPAFPYGEDDQSDAAVIARGN